MGSGTARGRKAKAESGQNTDFPDAESAGMGFPPGFLADFSSDILPLPPQKPNRGVEIAGKPLPKRLPGAEPGTVFLYAALMLAAISLFLYFIFDIGASYFSP